MNVFIPTPLRSYTGNRGEVESQGTTVAEVLAQLDRQHPGLCFRILSEQDTLREDIKIYVNEQHAALSTAVTDSDEVHIICVLSGG